MTDDTDAARMAVQSAYDAHGDVGRLLKKVMEACEVAERASAGCASMALARARWCARCSMPLSAFSKVGAGYPLAPFEHEALAPAARESEVVAEELGHGLKQLNICLKESLEACPHRGAAKMLRSASENMDSRWLDCAKEFLAAARQLESVFCK